MDLLTPGIGLIIWQIIVLFSIPVILVSCILILTSKILRNDQKIMWLVVTFCIPIIGGIIFLLFYRKIKTRHQNVQ